YDYIDYLINSGQGVPEFVFHQPYTVEQDFISDITSQPSRYFQKYWARYYSGDGKSLQILTGDKMYYDDRFTNRYALAGGGHLTEPNITLAANVDIDQEYVDDPLFPGDLSNYGHWFYGRVNQAYLSLHSDRFEFFLGRMKRNWGALNSPGLSLSDNPYSYDHALFSYTGDNVKFTTLYGRLEDVDALMVENPDSLIRGAQKHLIGHRFDFHITKNFQVGLTEMATYGGPGRGFEFVLLNPMNLYYGVQRNSGEILNVQYALDVFWKPVSKITFYSQFLVDDMILNIDPGVDDRAQYPDRLGVRTSLRTGDVMFEGLNTEITYVRIWNRTYQSRNTWENYHYRGLGLGYPCAGCEEVKVKLSYWDRFPYVFHTQFIAGRYGDVDVTDLFMMNIESFPVKPVTRNFLWESSVEYFYNESVIISGGISYIQDKNHYQNRIRQGEGFSMTVEVNYLFSIGF
ncbi:MAG TPA: capsule assembly Wzi family protein, partial [bacterium]|nr:capsule assembly Wzi family protein [bacterium]